MQTWPKEHPTLTLKSSNGPNMWLFMRQKQPLGSMEYPETVDSMLYANGLWYFLGYFSLRFWNGSVCPVAARISTLFVHSQDDSTLFPPCVPPPHGGCSPPKRSPPYHVRTARTCRLPPPEVGPQHKHAILVPLKLVPSANMPPWLPDFLVFAF